MRILTYIIIILSLIILRNKSYAQDPQFSQFFANPIYLNPAFAGSNNCPRFNLNYRNEWPSISGTFVTVTGSFDTYAPELNSGFGVMFTNDLAGKATIRTSSVNFIYSYNLELSRKWSLKFGLQLGIFNKALDWTKLSYGDQIDPRRGFIYQTNDKLRGGSIWNVDFSSGIILYSEKIYGGVSINHLNEPNESLLLATSNVPLRVSLHFGTKWKIRDSKDVVASISPNIIYQQQGPHQEINLGFYYEYRLLVLGLWARTSIYNPDAIIALIGIQNKTFKVGYSYDLTISRLGPNTGGSHEISFGINFPCKPKRRNFRVISCPSF